MTTIDTTIRVFQYKLSTNVLLLHKMLYRFEILQDLLRFIDSHLENLIVINYLPFFLSIIFLILEVISNLVSYD